MAKTVVVLGGSYSGLAVTHRLLKYTLPHEKDLKVILVSKNTHLYWNLASVRGIVSGVLTDDQLFQSIQPGLAQYPPGSVDFIVGTATALDPSAKTVQVTTSEGDGEPPRSIPYDYLVLATGSRPLDNSMPWKAAGSYEEVLEALHRTTEKVTAASHIIVAGAGATGIELAGELGYAYKDKKIILLCADSGIAGGDSIAGGVEKELGKLGVEIRKDVKAVDTTTAADGRTEVKLSHGETLVTDLYLSTVGLVPNNEYLPADFLNEKKCVEVDDQLRVRAAKDIWALGDIISRPRACFLNVEPQAAGVAKNIDAALKSKEQQLVKNAPVDFFVCATGRGRTVGRAGPVPLLSIMGWMAKGRTLAVERGPKFVNGSQF